MVDISNNLVDIWFFLWWSIFDKTPVAALPIFEQSIDDEFYILLIVIINGSKI